MNERSDQAIAMGIAFMLEIFLGLLAFLLVAAVVKFIIDWVDARRPVPRATKRDRYTVDRIEPRCERAGSQAEFARRIRAGGAR